MIMRTKHYLAIFFCAILAVLFAACKKEYKPNISEIKKISELAVLDCYYHTVARITKPADGIGKADKTLWEEFTVKVKLGIDTSKLDMIIKDSIVAIILPPVEIIGEPEILAESINKIASEDGVFKNDISGDEIIMLEQDAEKRVVSEVKEDRAIIENAVNRVKTVLESYIDEIGELSGKKYTIDWMPLEETENIEAEKNPKKNSENKAEE